MKRWQLYCVVAFASVILSIGMMANRGLLLGKRTWHSKFGWKATDYFDDPKVLALCHAIEANDLEAMRRAIADGADVNAIGEGNMTPLLWAFPDNHPERFELLLKSGADPNVVVDSEFGVPRHAIQPGTSVTEMATKSVFREHFDLVFKYGGNPNLINPRTKCPILITLVRSGNSFTKKRIGVLVAKGVDVNTKDRGGVPATINAACSFAQFDLALMLLEAGADPFAYYEEHNNRLIHNLLLERLETLGPTERQKHQKLLDWLVAHGESIEKANDDLKRWKSWASLPDKEQLRLRKAETAARKVREPTSAQSAEDTPRQPANCDLITCQ